MTVLRQTVRKIQTTALFQGYGKSERKRNAANHVIVICGMNSGICLGLSRTLASYMRKVGKDKEQREIQLGAQYVYEPQRQGVRDAGDKHAEDIIHALLCSAYRAESNRKQRKAECRYGYDTVAETAWKQASRNTQEYGMGYSCQQEHHSNTGYKLENDKRQCEPLAVWHPLFAETFADGMQHLAVTQRTVCHGTHKKPHKKRRLHVVREAAEKPSYALRT